MIAARDCAALSNTLQPMREPIDALLVPVAHAEAIAAALRAVMPHDV